MKVAIYCGSSLGNNTIYEEYAKDLAYKLYKENIQIVYGGSQQGLMGTISNESIKLGNKVTGVITYDLINKEVENPNISEIYRVDTINQRKEKMEDLADAFIAMPGGYGTLEELFEVLCLAYMGYHKKPCALLNINGYFDDLLKYLNNSSKEGFISKRHIDMIIVSDNIDEIIGKIKNYDAPTAKW